MVECAARGSGTPCTCDEPATRRCGLCGAVAYCSLSHQLSHWNDHKEECGRFEQQMRRTDVLNDFPFDFSMGITNLETRCSFLIQRGLHKKGIWKSECCCQSDAAYDDSCINDDWSLPSVVCPCTDPRTPLLKCLRSWNDYYQWRCLPFRSPVALMLHWPLTIYHCFQLSFHQALAVGDKLIIHYLGPKKELLQLATFKELGALFPHVHLHIILFGPAVPQIRDGKTIHLSDYPHCAEKACACKSSSRNDKLEVPLITNSLITVEFHKGLYHECYKDDIKVSSPHIIVAPNAGIGAYSSWVPTIELIKEMGVPAIFTDFCEEAANLAVNCIQTVTRHPPRIPVQINPFRQPIPLENNALYLPCYSNCFIFGM